jgi:DNA polymerase V
MFYAKKTPGLWALVDCNNFYASCERLFRPDLIGKPIVVLSNNDGCIVARSNEAKALGVGMGEPEFKVRALLKKYGVTVFSSNYALYGDISSRVMRTMESLVPVVEQYSIDEAFLPLSGSLAVNAAEIAAVMRERIRKWTGIVVSIGIGPTRTLAKLASDLAKKRDGVLCLHVGSPETEHILASTPAGDIWGIGRRSAEKLKLRNINTARELRDADRTLIQKLLSVTGVQTLLELRGIPCIDETSAPAPRRTLVSSRSFGQRITEKDHLAEALTMHATRAGERLRRERLEAGGIAVHIRTSRHGQGPFYDETAEIALPFPTDSTRELIKAAKAGLETVFRQGFSYAKAGIMLFDLAPREGRQGSLLDILSPNERKQRDEKLMYALDALNTKFGRGTVRFAAEGDKVAPWHMQHTRRSPRWTTAWGDIPSIRGS